MTPGWNAVFGCNCQGTNQRVGVRVDMQVDTRDVIARLIAEKAVKKLSVAALTDPSKLPKVSLRHCL